MARSLLPTLLRRQRPFKSTFPLAAAEGELAVAAPHSFGAALLRFGDSGGRRDGIVVGGGRRWMHVAGGGGENRGGGFGDGGVGGPAESSAPVRALSDAAGGDDGQEEASRRMYDAQSTRWVRREPRCLSDFTGRPVVFSLLEPHVRSERGAYVLDVGCGEGYCARVVADMGASRVVGLDVSEGMVEGARASSEGDDRFRYFAASCGDLMKTLEERRDEIGLASDRDGVEASFDVAMAVFLFNYLTIEEMREAATQIHAALKPGGTFVFSVPHPSMIYCHDPSSVFHLRSEGEGYFSSRDRRILGQIGTLDGEKLNIMSVHKTLNDYFNCIRAAGFEIVDVREAGVTEEHMKKHPVFFESVRDRPLHLIFELRKK